MFRASEKEIIIPLDIFSNVFQFLDGPSLVRMSTVCKKFKAIAGSDVIWRKKCEEYVRVLISSSNTQNAFVKDDERKNLAQSLDSLKKLYAGECWVEIYKTWQGNVTFELCSS